MRQGFDRIRENKLAAAGCIFLVVALTALGVWTNRTAERQTAIEKTFKVQHTEVVQALCNHPYTVGCLHRAVNVIKTCLSDPECSSLLGRPLLRGPDISRQQAEREVRVEKSHNNETHNSSQGIVEPAPESGGGPGGGSPGSGGHGGGHPPPAPTEEGPAGSPPPHEEGHEGPHEEPAREEPVEISPPPVTAAPSGLLPGAVESVEGIVGCVSRLELGCAVQGVLGVR